jgi:hypothetical protein
MDNDGAARAVAHIHTLYAPDEKTLELMRYIKGSPISSSIWRKKKRKEEG